MSFGGLPAFFLPLGGYSTLSVAYVFRSRLERVYLVSCAVDGGLLLVPLLLGSGSGLFFCVAVGKGFFSVLGEPVELCVDRIPESGDSLTVGVFAFAVDEVAVAGATGFTAALGGLPLRLIGIITAAEVVLEGTPLMVLLPVATELAPALGSGDSVLILW